MRLRISYSFFDNTIIWLKLAQFWLIEGFHIILNCLFVLLFFRFYFSISNINIRSKKKSILIMSNLSLSCLNFAKNLIYDLTESKNHIIIL